MILLWLTGARPSELKDLTKEDFEIKETFIAIKMPIKKRRKEKFTVKDRVPEFDRPLPPDKDTLIEYVAWYIEHQAQPGRLFDVGVRSMEYIVLKASQKALKRNVCPYNFRHGRMTTAGRKGATIDELMQIKGATDVRSVAPYLHARPFRVKI
jgi:integrase